MVVLPIWPAVFTAGVLAGAPAAPPGDAMSGWGPPALAAAELAPCRASAGTAEGVRSALAGADSVLAASGAEARAGNWATARLRPKGEVFWG